MRLLQCVFPITDIQIVSEHRASRKDPTSFSSLLFAVSGQGKVNNCQPSSCPQTLLESPFLCQGKFTLLNQEAPTPESARNQAGGKWSLDKEGPQSLKQASHAHL